MRDEETARVAAVRQPTKFPRNAIGLDSWANVHLIHQKQSKNASIFDHSLTLAHGNCKCHREVGRKGVPRVYVPWTQEGDNIDLFPEGFLWERGCAIQRGQEHTLTTPKNRVVHIKMWGIMPYILKDDLQRIIDDLPEETQPGRSGLELQTPTAARVCKTECSSAQLKLQLKHLESDISKEKLNNIRSKYRNLPDAYYGGDSSKYITPDKLAEVPKSEVKMWEWYSGSSSLSTYLQDQQVDHLPPIDYRYGWNLAKHEHQVKLLDTLLSVGVQTLFASPNCAPWGNHTRGLPLQQRNEKTAR